MDGRAHALRGIDLRVSPGVEIGPLTRPLVRKDEAEVYYIDRASAAELRAYHRHNPEIDVDAIVEVDFVWGERTLSQCVSGRRLDWCFAGHVVEHVPDLIGWLAEVEEILRPGGILSLIVPDRRYSFDYLRRTSVLSEAIEAHLMRLRRPSSRQVHDQVANSVAVDTARMWTDAAYRAGLKPGREPSFALRRAREP